MNFVPLEKNKMGSELIIQNQLYEINGRMQMFQYLRHLYLQEHPSIFPLAYLEAVQKIVLFQLVLRHKAENLYLLHGMIRFLVH